MGTSTVKDVMTATVVVARMDTAFKEIVDVLTRHAVSALPVLDGDGRVVGVVSEADLLPKLEVPPDHTLRRLFDRKRQATMAKDTAETAAELMTGPAVTIGPDAAVGAAARLMERHRVKRLPVVDDGGRLVGIVSRRDLLRTYLRSDHEIHRDIVNMIIRLMIDDPARLDLTVDEGVVTVRGTVDRRTSAELAVRLIRAIDGVVAVADQLGWDYDDHDASRRHFVFDAQVPPTIRWP